jgi:serine/threonine-protein kinase
MLQIGDQFDRFQIRAFIAQGGMADIYQAYDLLHSREVVLKIPNRMMIGDPAQYERFQRELEVTNILNHPAIQHGLGSGQYNRTPYLVTEFVQGESMRDIVEKQTPMPPDKAVALIRQIADAMAYCHEHDVIHRDLKPENIIVTAEGQPVIVDFGLALTKGSRRVTYANLTPTAGTPDYMSPEQVEGQRGDQRTDIYAVGVMLYELLTGEVPFVGTTHAAIMANRLRGPIPRPDHQRSDIAPAIAAICVRCLQRDPPDRYPTMCALLHDLDHWDEVDLSILDKVQAAPTAAFWQSEWFQGLMVAVIVMLIIVVLAVIGQGVAR